jgi:hypothetical protein
MFLRLLRLVYPNVGYYIQLAVATDAGLRIAYQGPYTKLEAIEQFTIISQSNPFMTPHIMRTGVSYSFCLDKPR